MSLLRLKSKLNWNWIETEFRLNWNWMRLNLKSINNYCNWSWLETKSNWIEAINNEWICWWRPLLSAGGKIAFVIDLGLLFALPCFSLLSSGLLCCVATHTLFIACGKPRPLSLQMSILENLQMKSNVKAMSENHSDFIDIDSSALFCILNF